jgi:hypothetical protein
LAQNPKQKARQWVDASALCRVRCNPVFNPNHIQANTMKQNPSKLLLASGALFAAATLSAQITVVHWQGDYVESNQNFARSNTSSSQNVDFEGNPGRHTYKAWSEADSLNPGSNYTVPADRSGTFYGGILSSYTSSDTSVFLGANQQVQHNNAGDRILLRSQVTTNENFTQRHGAVAIGFLKSDFLGGGDSQSVFFDADSSMTVNFAVLSAAFSARFMVKQNDAWFVSNTLYTGGGTKTLQGSDLLNETWAVYNPTGNFLLFDASAASFNPVTWTNIQGVGYQAQFIQTDSLTSGAIDASANNFQVLAAVPEPATYALLSGLMALGFILWRRRR